MPVHASPGLVWSTGTTSTGHPKASTDSAKRDLARGSVEDLKQKTEAYRVTLEALRQLVPDQNERRNRLERMMRFRFRGILLRF